MQSELNVSNITNLTIVTKIWESMVPPAFQFVLGVAGNAIAVVSLVLSRKRHKWKPFYRLVRGLALTDGGGILLIGVPIMMRYFSNFTYDFPQPLCDYSAFIISFMLTSSAMIVCAMSLDRFMAISYPFKYNVIERERRANIILIFVWVLGTVISSLALIGIGSNVIYYPGSWCFMNFVGTSTLDRVNSYIYSIFGLFVLSTTISLNCFVMVKLCKNVNEKRNDQRKRQSTIYNMILLLVFVIVFTLCWSPQIFLILGYAALLNKENPSRDLLIGRIAMTNSVIDPWIYILLRKENLQALQRRCGRFCCKVSSTDNDRQSDANFYLEQSESI
ncbi:prostaglandin E2 receptor EP4 subtype-like [Saccostrea echinata]|uniref:prostaglandin E2 receptor EP4 subtype-like n=1 Tax=Saccostrea echinata TaxID=191078 RepID=UPI002A82D6F5|nr:prostaglandin E2 receptor EP4 subtype-like [Saccostrea echinata]